MDLSLIGKKVAGRTYAFAASNSALAVSAPFVAPSQLPIVTMAISVPVKAAISTIEHYHREDAILNNFREELAAKFGVAPDEVTHDNLRYMAFGNSKIGIEPQPVFKDVIEKNDKMRWIDIGANICASVFAMGFYTMQGAAISQAVTGFAANSGIGLIASSAVAPLVGAVAVSLAVAAVVTVCDYFVTKVAKEITQTPEKTAYELIENIERQKNRGIAITQDRVMGVFATADQGLKAEIMNDFGAPYNALPEKQRLAVLDKYAAALKIVEYTDKINHDVIKVNELAFAVVGDSSGLAEKPAKPVVENNGLVHKLQDFGKSVQHQIGGLFHHDGKAVVAPKIANIQEATPAAVSAANVTKSSSTDMPHQANFEVGSGLFVDDNNPPIQTLAEKPSNKLDPISAQLSGSFKDSTMPISHAIH
jgi:hypothetical protein